jgi:ATP-binding cassette subfamily C protein
MNKIVRRSLNFMSSKERTRFFVFLSMRALVALLDLIGILAIGFLATSMALEITQGSSTSRVIEVGSLLIPSATLDNVPIIASMVLGLFASKAVLSVLLTRQLAFFLARIEARAAREIARNAFGKGLEGARLNSREEILFAVQAGSPSAFNIVLNSVGTLTAEGFLFALVLTAFTFVNPAVAIGAVVYFGIIGFLIQFFLGRVMQKNGVKVARGTVEANVSLSDLGEVLRESAILGRQGFFFDKIFEARLRTSGSAATQYVLGGMPRYIVETALIIAITVFVLLQAYSGEIASSAATIGIFLSGGLRLTSSLLPLQGALLGIRQATPEAERALDLLSTSRASNDGDSAFRPLDPTVDSLAVSIKHLSFRFRLNESVILSDINLDIRQGSQVAFIGASGSGKSTLADLILGLLVPTSGTITVGGRNPEELIQHQPGLLGYVPQKPGMISGSIAQNIALGQDERDIDVRQLQKSIADAHLTELIESLPKGVHTQIGKRKDELSGGQLQRIGLARALYSQPKLLILDEATSALDAESENEINKAIDEMRGKVTVILIAHRLNTIQRSDTLFLIDQGKIVASGTFSQLQKSSDQVKNLVELMSLD